jgi:hypothetical protein
VLELILKATVIGAGATALMDVWAIFLNAAFKMPLPNWALVGRWFCGLTGGKVFHDDIAAAAPWPNELAVGWIAHYAIGILYAGALIFFAGPEWLAAPTFLPAWIVGMVTVGAGWFLLQPGMGAGWAASKRPNPMQVRLFNILAHTVFAAGLYGTALIVARLT